MAAASKSEHPPHPFYPIGVEIVGYLANRWSVPALLGIFLGGWLVILALTWASVSWFLPRLRQADKLIILWFILSEARSMHEIHSPTDHHSQKAEQSTSSSRAILPSTTRAWGLRKTCSANYGRNMRSPTRDTLPRIHLCSAWNLSPRYDPRSRQGFLRELTCSAALLGSSVLLYSVHDYCQSPSSISTSSSGVSWPDIWRHPILCNQHV